MCQSVQLAYSSLSLIRRSVAFHTRLLLKCHIIAEVNIVATAVVAVAVFIVALSEKLDDRRMQCMKLNKTKALPPKTNFSSTVSMNWPKAN